MRAGQQIAEPVNSQELGLHVGDQVEHPAFGVGAIIAVDGEGEKTEAVINFSGRRRAEAPLTGMGPAEKADVTLQSTRIQ